MALPIKINLDSILKLPLSKRILILAGVNLAVAGLLYWFLIGPKYARVAELDMELSGLTVKLNESRQIAADIPKYLKEKEEMEEKLAAAVAQLPNAKEIPDLIDGISGAGVQAGLKILLFKPDKEVEKGFYAEVPVKMTVEGRYDSLYDFSVKIGNLPRIVNLGSLEVVSQGHKNRVPVLKTDLVATTFRFLSGEGAAEPEEEGDRKKGDRKK
ncbi:MAG: type 4a pilus biogenesis protein PilO [Deltaproteobacteria bacterium]|nr:type 4a pilus biogenesis protein PilO [Deltaproteobacteria bacterium]MBZ0221241.1 type 4a pilus biogenesis protein PilO [Deltaproteobacteria bacterium]